MNISFNGRYLQSNKQRHTGQEAIQNANTVDRTFIDTVIFLKFSDARKLCCKLPKIQTKRPNLRVFCLNDANGIANSED